MKNVGQSTLRRNKENSDSVQCSLRAPNTRCDIFHLSFWSKGALFHFTQKVKMSILPEIVKQMKSKEKLTIKIEIFISRSIDNLQNS